MKKSILLWMSAMLMLSVGMMSCSEDEALDENHKNIIGEWQLLNYRGGFSPINVDLEPGEVMVTFTKDGVVRVNGKEGNYGFPLLTGTYNYSFEEKTPYKAKESTTVLVISSSINDYYFHFEDGMLLLSDGVYDGFEYKFKKVE